MWSGKKIRNDSINWGHGKMKVFANKLGWIGRKMEVITLSSTKR